MKIKKTKMKNPGVNRSNSATLEGQPIFDVLIGSQFSAVTAVAVRAATAKEAEKRAQKIPAQWLQCVAIEESEICDCCREKVGPRPEFGGIVSRCLETEILDVRPGNTQMDCENN